MHALLHSVPLTLQQAIADLETPGHSQANLDQSLVGSLWAQFLLGPGVHEVLFVPSKSLFPQSCVSSGGSIVGLMVTSSKRVYATLRSAAPRAPAPVAGHCWPVPSHSNTQRQVWLSLRETIKLEIKIWSCFSFFLHIFLPSSPFFHLQCVTAEAPKGRCWLCLLFSHSTNTCSVNKLPGYSSVFFVSWWRPQYTFLSQGPLIGGRRKGDSPELS